MANGRSGSLKGPKAKRVSGRFVAMPYSVLDSEAYMRLGHPARSLLWDIARQYAGDNNGRLLASAGHLAARGWTSNDTITRAKRELLETGFIYETVMGHRPNRASWYAVTWLDLDRIEGYDSGAFSGFERGAFATRAPTENASLKPAGGAKATSIAPPNGASGQVAAPSPGAIERTSTRAPTPPAGDHLEKPSARAVSIAGIQSTKQP
jgi:hypothetical protein